MGIYNGDRLGFINNYDIWVCLKMWDLPPVYGNFVGVYDDFTGNSIGNMNMADIKPIILYASK